MSGLSERNSMVRRNVTVDCRWLRWATVVIAACTLHSPVLAETHWVSANNVHLRYELTGSGPSTVVLLHEMSMSLESWDDVVPALTPNRRVLRYDLRGFGLSERIRGAITMEDEVADLRALLDALGIGGKVTLVGGAVGAAIALQFAAEHPERVNGVVAISPAAYLQPQPQRVPSRTPAAPSPEVMNKLQEDAYPSSLRSKNPANYQRYTAMQAATDMTSGLATATMLYAAGFKEVLPNIQCPTIIVATSLYKARAIEEFRELAQALPRGRFEVLATSHFAPIQSPELVGPLLLKFLAEVEAAK